MENTPEEELPDNVRHLHEPSGDYNVDCARSARAMAQDWINEMFPPKGPADVIELRPRGS